MTNENTNCTCRPVSAGTHKLSDALHTEIAEPNVNERQTEATKVSRMLRGMGANSFITKQLDRAADLIDAQEADLSALRTRCAAQQAELAKEAARTAEQKLRADQMSAQHETQAALNREARAKLAAGVLAAAPDARDAAFEAVRNRLCGLQRYSFVLDDDGAVRRVQDRTGNWIEFDDAHELFDPVSVDAAIAAQAGKGV